MNSMSRIMDTNLLLIWTDLDKVIFSHTNSIELKAEAFGLINVQKARIKNSVEILSQFLYDLYKQNSSVLANTQMKSLDLIH